MSRGRLEAFSDAVIAILITIMVLNLRPPAGADLASLDGMVSSLLVYVLSFVFLGIYWVNHHHLMQVVDRINGAVLWANMALLFSLSLVPIATAWLSEHPRASGPVFAYGAVLFLAAVSYYVLTLALLAIHPPGSRLATAVRFTRKEWVSMAVYLAALPVALIAPLAAIGMFIAIAILWLVPDRRIERLTADWRDDA